MFVEYSHHLRFHFDDYEIFKFKRALLLHGVAVNALQDAIARHIKIKESYLPYLIKEFIKRLVRARGGFTVEGFLGVGERSSNIKRSG